MKKYTSFFYPYSSNSKEFKDLNKLVNNATTVITIPTPKGWKCKRKGCKADYKHSHSTYSSLKKK